MAAPEIRLSVGLDLEFFRGQMRKAVNIAQSEFNASLKVTIDKNKINTELKNLERAIKRGTYRIEIGGNLEKAPDKVANLKRALSGLDGTKVEISVGGVASINAKESRKIRTALRASIMGEGGKILVPASIVPVITNADVATFKKAVAEKLSGIKVAVGVETGAGPSATKTRITPEEISRQAKEAFSQGSLGKLFEQAATGVGNVRAEQARAGLVGRLDKGPSGKGGYNKAGLEKIITELGGTPSGTVSEMRAQAKKLASSVDDALIDRVWRSVKDLQMNMRYSGGAGYGVGQSISRLVNTMSLVSSDPKAARQKLRSLPPDRITTEMAGRASEQAMANTALGQARAPVGSKFQNSFDKYLNAVVDQAMVDVSQARQRFGLRQMGVNLSQKLLPAAGETGGVVRDVQWQSRIAAARARSAAREASALRESQMYATVAGQVPLGNTAPRLPAGNRGGALALRDTIGRVGMPGREKSGIGGLNIPNLPGAGLVREIGTEFAFAAKQVLLFGTAYKALAFLTGFPQQVGDAVGALQTFRNTLKAISPSAGEAAASSQFILDIVDKYNVPLQSARDGFTKLYASMQPAGFSGNEIRDLFLGISQSAATFGMSADKVDRVNYAFAQMASKGQVMSEELKGQLGDVLPGAMAIFAEAAGFKGPEAIKTFSKALEDGAYKGGAMKALLLNVGTIMRKEFGSGAEGAARTFQGSINRMQNSLKLLYESFEPVAIGFLNSVVMPMTAGLKTVTQGVTAYFKGQRAATPEAENFNKILQVLAPSLAGIGKNIAYALQQLLPLVQVVSAVALQVARFLALPLVGYLAGTYLQVMLLTSGFSLLATSGIALATASMVRFVAQGVVAASVMLGLQRATQQTTVATFLFGQTLQAVMIKSVIGIALVAISTLIAKIMELRGQLAAVGGDAKGMEDIAKSSAKMGDVEGTKEALGNIKDRLATFKKLQKELRDAKKTSAGGSAFSDRATINTGYEIGSDTARKLIELGVLNEKVLTKTSNGYSLLESQMGIVNSLVNKNVAEFEKAGQKGNILTDEAIRKNEQLKKQTELLPIPPGGEGKKPESLETYYSLQDQLAKAASAADIARIQDEFEERFRLANSYYDLQEARANSFQKITINFQKELLAIEQRRQKAMLDAELDVRKARESVASEAVVGGGAASGSTAGVSGLTEYLTGDPSSSGYRADHATIQQYHDHLAFATREAAVNAYKKMVEAGIKVTEFKGYGAGVTGPHSGPGSLHHAGLAMDVPGYQWGGSGAIGTKEYAGSARVRAVMGMGGGVTAGAAPPGKILGSERRQTLATQQTGFALEVQRVANLVAEKKAADDAALAIENYVAAIAPVAEQELQNQLLSKRIELMQTGVAGDYLDAEIKVFEIQEKQKFAIASATAEIEKNNKAVDDGKMGKDDANRANAKQNDTINRLIANVPKYITLLELQTVAQQKLNFEAARGELNKQMTMARALTPDAELRVQLGEKYPGDISMQEQEFAQTKLLEKASKLKQDLQNIASSIGNAFGDAFSKVITGAATAQQALAGMFQGIADSFAQMVQEMIAQWLKTQILEGFGKLFNLVAPLAGAAGGFSSGAAGFGGGFDSGIAALPGIPDFSGAFKTAANGAVWTGGFQAFADGGIVKGPTLGLVGEGRYNEAVVPLPDGKSIPVDLSGMGGGAGAISTNIVINVNNGQAQSNTSGGASDLGRKMEGAVKQVLANELRPGGLLSGGRR